MAHDVCAAGISTPLIDGKNRNIDAVSVRPNYHLHECAWPVSGNEAPPAVTTSSPPKVVALKFETPATPSLDQTDSGLKRWNIGPVSNVEITARTMSEAKANSESIPCSWSMVAATISMRPLHWRSAPRPSV